MQDLEKILRYAMQMEVSGYNFYVEKAESIGNATTRHIFATLAETEKDHYDFLETILNKHLEGQDVSKEVGELAEEENIFKIREESEHLESTLEESDVPDLTVVRTAYLIEKDAKEFYQQAADNADSEALKTMFQKLSNWEKGHEDLFKGEYDRLMKEYMTLPWGG